MMRARRRSAGNGLSGRRTRETTPTSTRFSPRRADRSTKLRGGLSTRVRVARHLRTGKRLGKPASGGSSKSDRRPAAGRLRSSSHCSASRTGRTGDRDARVARIGLPPRLKRAPTATPCLWAVETTGGADQFSNSHNLSRTLRARPCRAPFRFLGTRAHA
jgi:hypothetical protein